MLAELGDGVAMVRVGVGVLRTDDDAGRRMVGVAPGGQHGGGERLASAVAERQKQRHFALDMVVSTDILLNERSRGRTIALGGFLPLAVEELFHGMAHEGGFLGRLGLGLDAEPRMSAGRVTNVLHATSDCSPESGPQSDECKSASILRRQKGATNIERSGPA